MNIKKTLKRKILKCAAPKKKRELGPISFKIEKRGSS